MPVTKFSVAEKYSYLEGFSGYHQSEAFPGANPVGANSPQIPPYGLSTERISGTSFTASRDKNLQTWLYRVTSSLEHSEFTPYSTSASQSSQRESTPHFSSNNLHWPNFPISPNNDWISGQKVLCFSGSPSTKTGLSYIIYAADKDMGEQTVFASSDGDFLIIPQAGVLDIQTELGNLLVRQNEIAVIPRGIRYRVTLPNGPARGYICELYQGHFQLPSLGVIGSCSLTNERDFQVPVATFDGNIDNEGIARSHPLTMDWKVVTKYVGKLFACTQSHTPFDVAAWHGTYYPYKYDLGRFSVLGSLLYDHSDPSLYTVLTAPSHREPGTSVVDFAIIPPRWQMMEDTYWPPYYHRNSMSEFAGAIINSQDMGDFWNKREIVGKFKPFGAMLNGAMVSHGPDNKAHENARKKNLKPQKVGLEGFMVFLLESESMMGLTEWGMNALGKTPSIQAMRDQS